MYHVIGDMNVYDLYSGNLWLTKSLARQRQPETGGLVAAADVELQMEVRVVVPGVPHFDSQGWRPPCVVIFTHPHSVDGVSGGSS